MYQSHSWSIEACSSLPCACGTLTKEDVTKSYKDVFTGLGRLPGTCHIELDDTKRPVQHSPRKVPIPLREELKTKIKQPEEDGIVSKVKQPTDWINSMVAVKMPNKLRVCLDPKDLNNAIKRPHYPMPTLEDVAPRLVQAKIFSVVDAKDGFLQVVLDEPSSLLTTFWAPFGRYKWNRLPFGISSAPEDFERRLTEALEGLDNVAVVADNILIFGCDDTHKDAEADHDKAMLALLERARQKNLKLNKNDLKFKEKQVTYMGHILTEQGIKPDLQKITAIQDMQRPEDPAAVLRLLGMLNFLGQYLPNLSHITEPLRRLTHEDAEWEWLPEHEAALNEIKSLLSKEPCLRYYDVKEEVTIEAGASQFGLGAVLYQQGQPVAWASKILTKTERNYPPIEKEMLALVYACERFDHYLHGKKSINALTDHKPLETIFQKTILSATKRLQRMRLRLQKYPLKISYQQGPKMFVSDTLSRAPRKVTAEKTDTSTAVFYAELEEINLGSEANITDARMQQVRQSTQQDATMQVLMNIILTGWPDSKEMTPLSVREYWTVRNEPSTQDGVVNKATKVLIPKSLRPEMLKAALVRHMYMQYIGKQNKTKWLISGPMEFPGPRGCKLFTFKSADVTRMHSPSHLFPTTLCVVLGKIIILLQLLPR